MNYEIPFDFGERIPLMSCTINGLPFDRFILDTGAPVSFLHKDTAEALQLGVNHQNRVHIESLRFGTLNAGPCELKVGSFGAIRTAGLLGTREMLPYCVTLDLDRSLCVLGASHSASVPFSPFELLNGRPVVRLQHSDVDLIFVLDTGSSANWLFASGQEKLHAIGTMQEEPETAQGARGGIPIQNRKAVANMAIGGRELPIVTFLLSEQFAGHNAPEDGILGIGALVASGKVIIDFPFGRFALTETQNQEQPNM